MKFKLTNVKVAAAFEFAVTVGAAVLASPLLWFIAASSVDRLA
jgi:hypothetical protein